MCCQSCTGGGGGDDRRDVDVNWVLALATGLGLDESRVDPLDLHSRLRLLLDVLDKQSLPSPLISLLLTHQREGETYTRSNDFGSHVKVAQRFNRDENLLFRPLALRSP